MTPWGKKAMGVKTRKTKKASTKINRTYVAMDKIIRRKEKMARSLKKGPFVDAHLNEKSRSVK